MRIGCSGVAGFMASHLAESLANDGHEVYGIDNLSIGIKENIPKNIKFAEIDMRNAEDMDSMVKEANCEIWFHAAAWAHEGLSQFMPRLITENNYNAFINLITPAIKYGLKKIVIFSSMSVYGGQIPPMNEEMPVKPEDVYAVAKAAMEKTTEILADVHNFDYTIVRPHNVYGPRQMLHDPYRNVIGIFCNRIMKGVSPIIYGSGEQTRAFSYIDDVIPYVKAAGFQENCSKQIINIGPLEEYSVNYLAIQVLKAFGREDLIPIHVLDRPREVKDAFCTNDKAIKLLGYKTSTTFEDGIQKMVEWAKTQGPQEFKYLDNLELEGKNIPETWRDKSL